MIERRKNKRLPIKIELAINELFKQDNAIIDGINTEAHVVNISRTGIGLESTAVLPMNYYFDARIDFHDKSFFYCVLKIIREDKHEDTTIYGCEFVGLADFLRKKVDEYEEWMAEEQS